jgi:hypothetical protein
MSVPTKRKQWYDSVFSFVENTKLPLSLTGWPYCKYGFIKSGTRIATPKVSIFPNPVSGNHFSVKLSNFEDGKYVVSLRNINGSIILNEAINHNGKISSYNIDIPAIINPGTYFVHISGKDTSITNKIIKY